MLNRDLAAALALSDEGIALAVSSEHGMPLVPYMSAILGWAQALAGDVDAVTAEAIGGSAQSASGTWAHFFSAMAADARLATRDFAAALTHADLGSAQLGASTGRWFEAELHRLRGEALAGLDAADPDAESELRQAVDVAERQGAAGLQRRAEESLRRLRNP
jgi:predicted ATPase